MIARTQIEMMNVFVIALQTVQELVPQNIKRFEDEPIMFIGDSELDKRAYETILEAEAAIATNVFWFNCTAHKMTCDGFTLPQFRVGYKKGYFSVYGEETADARKLSQFVSTTRQSMFNHFGSEALFIDEMEQQEEPVFLIARGPNEDEMEQLCLYQKNRVRAAYFEAPSVSLTLHRYGLVLKYSGELEMEAIGDFIEGNRGPIFGRLTDEALTQPIGRMLVLLVFNPQIDAQKETAKQMRELVKKVTIKQSLIAKKASFHHTTPGNKALKAFFAMANVTTESPRLFVFKGSSEFVEAPIDFLKAESILQDIAEGTQKFSAIKPKEKKEPERFHITYDDDDF